MKVGDLVVYNEEPKFRMWLSPDPEPLTSRGTTVVRGEELLILLENNKEAHYSRVLTTSGITGWIYTGYLRKV